MQGNNSLLPWLQSHWKQLLDRHLQNRLPHALLIAGPSGIGKSSFSRFVSQSFLCQRVDGTGYCGECESCHLIAAGSHPDWLLLEPPEKKSVISVDQVRGLINELELTPQCGQKKIALIDPAESMNTHAANCLLKTLEEPAPSDLIILICSVPAYLPATIRSRCQTIFLSVQHPRLALGWLRAQGIEHAERFLSCQPDSPLGALRLADAKELQFQQELLEDVNGLVLGRSTVTRTAAKYSGVETRSVLSLLLRFISQAIKHKMHCADRAGMYLPENRIKALSDCLSLEDLFNIYNKLQKLIAINNSSFKTQAVLEGIFADMRLNHLK